jgi:hypothetical protein
MRPQILTPVIGQAVSLKNQEAESSELVDKRDPRNFGTTNTAQARTQADAMDIREGISKAQTRAVRDWTNPVRLCEHFSYCFPNPD